MKLSKSKYSIGSLFSGVGGFELGFKKAGYLTKWAVENDPFAAITYKLNFKNTLIEQDIKKITNKEISNLNSVDVITAGFPCQAFSVAGYQRGFEDPRGNLFLEILRFVKKLETKPKILLLENVRNFYSHDNKNTWATIRTYLKKSGYSYIPLIVNTSSSTGIPQNRERAYIVCFLNDKTYINDPINLVNKKNLLMAQQNSFDLYGSRAERFLNNLTKNFLEEKKDYKDFLEPEKNIDDKYSYSINEFKTVARSGDTITEELKKRASNDSFVYQWRRVGEVRINKSNEVPTLTASMGSGGHNVPIVNQKTNIRKLTPRECFNFQGFPRTFKLPNNVADNQLYKQSGNSVTVKLVAKIASSIKKELDLDGF
jgi:DNA (cytosine-5)-methyltransferase 1